MNFKAPFCVLSCVFVTVCSMLLPASVLGQSHSTFSSTILPAIPGIVTPAPLPPPPAEEALMPGDAYVATTGIAEAGSTDETGKTIQLSTRTGSESARGVALLSSPLSSAPYVSPLTDTDLAIAAPFGGPGYVAGRSRPGDSRFGRTLSGRAAYDLTTLGPSSVPVMESALAAGPLDTPAKPPATPSATTPGGSGAITGTTGK